MPPVTQQVITTETRKPEVKQANNVLGLRIAGDGNKTLVYRNGITREHINKLANLICVQGIDKLSQRKLHDAGLGDRFSNQHPTPGEIIAWLKQDGLIVASGNEQYAVTELLFDSLLPYSPTPTNGVNHGEYIVQDTTTPPPLA